MKNEHRYDTILKYIDGRPCSIFGFGVSNLPLAKILSSSGIDFDVWDKKPKDQLGADAEELFGCGTIFHVIGKDPADVSGKLIFRSPGIRPDTAELSEAVSNGAELCSEMELFLRLTPARVYALTGSDGKTTSTTLTGRFLEKEALRKNSGRVYVGGNIGTPLLEFSDVMSSDDSAVLELSSFQLMTVSSEISPVRAALTNISPNHLDWHTDMSEYIRAKKNIVGDRTERLVTNRHSPDALDIAIDVFRESGEKVEIYLFSSTASSYEEVFGGLPISHGKAIYQSHGHIVISDGKKEEKLLDIQRIRVPGRHNIENYMTAMGLVYGDVDLSVFGTVADEFTGVEHRLELVRTIGSTDFYNSSIDSSPTRTAAALSALSGRDIVAICGGYDKKIPFQPLAKSLIANVRAVVLTGATGEKIRAVIEADEGYDPQKLQVEYRGDFDEAVKFAASLGRPGGCVLLSPACASFDAFKNFSERGERFRKVVSEISEPLSTKINK